jgi:hypothetical protein
MYVPIEQQQMFSTTQQGSSNKAATEQRSALQFAIPFLHREPLAAIPSLKVPCSQVGL